jgi:hypothetical protein
VVGGVTPDQPIQIYGFKRPHHALIPAVFSGHPDPGHHFDRDFRALIARHLPHPIKEIP